MNVALLGTSLADVSALAAHLRDGMREAGIPARLKVIDAARPDFDVARFDVVLLLGLGHRQHDALGLADDLLRARLNFTQTPFQVVYGSDEEKLQQAMRAVYLQVGARGSMHQGKAQSPPAREGRPGGTGWVWLCDKCSDPQCEHQLLTDLLAQRKTRAETEI